MGVGVGVVVVVDVLVPDAEARFVAWVDGEDEDAAVVIGAWICDVVDRGYCGAPLVPLPAGGMEDEEDMPVMRRSASFNESSAVGEDS